MAGNGGNGEGRGRRRRRLLPPFYFLAAIVAMAVLHLLLPGARWVWWPWRLSGIPVGLAGVGLDLAAGRLFQRHGTTVKPFEASSALVTGGVFGWSRNPMYLGLVLVLLGLALVLGTLTPLLVVPLFALWIDRRFIAVEERDLAGRFGAEYLAYRKRVRRWL